MCIRRFLGIPKNTRRDSILMEKTCLYGRVGDVAQLGTHPSNLCMPFGGGRKIYEHEKIKVGTTASGLVEWLSVQVKDTPQPAFELGSCQSGQAVCCTTLEQAFGIP